MQIEKTTNILLLEDTNMDADLLQAMLRDVKDTIFKFSRARDLSEALQLLKDHDYDIALVDLTLPDSKGIDTFTRFYESAGGVPIIIVSYLHDESLAFQAVQNGAQDYLIKGKFSKDVFVRSIRYAMERQRLQDIIREQSLKDSLTGLYNRGGFYTLAEQLLLHAKRNKNGITIFYLDYDKLKDVNDLFGHREGDEAIKEIAKILCETFRASDLIARIGGDEFVVLTSTNSGKPIDALFERLNINLQDHNTNGKLPYVLSLSAGCSSYSTDEIPSVDQMIAEADKAMYIQKRKKQDKMD